MSGHDLYADDFPPHGTTAGYRAGCHSSGACPGRLERGQTCVQAKQRYASDFGYRKAVDRGEELAVLAVMSVAAAAPVKPKARRKPPAPQPVVDAPELKVPENWPAPAPEVEPQSVALPLVPANDEPEPVEPTPAPEPPRKRPRRQKSAAVPEDVLDLLDESIKAMAEVLVVMKNTADEIRDQRRALLRREAARNRREQS